MVQLQLRIFNRLSPGIRNLHPIEADAREECIEFTGQVFRSGCFDDVYRAPSYRAWLGASGYEEGDRSWRGSFVTYGGGAIRRDAGS